MSPPLVLALTLVAVFAVACGAVWRALRAARAERDALREAAGRCDRDLGLVVQELHAIGLGLLGQAGGAASPSGQAAAQLLALADSIGDRIATEGRPRTLSAETLPLLPVLEAAVAATAAQISPTRRDWRLAPDFAGLTLRADARALRGALEQVLGRAARMTRDGDWIGLRPVLGPDSLTILIEDEGAGLAAADIAPDCAGSGAPSAERTRGLGFGLAAARALLEAHGGSLRFEAAPGIGARAWLTLPRDRLLGAAPG
jgi:signal transduction histidine kinase